ncbi:MAG: hypothetical protein JOZ57_13035 [Abitibacteriaceae bacterium]|nr:hypothetical protein [Abditibacteriaceae bacterium]
MFVMFVMWLRERHFVTGEAVALRTYEVNRLQEKLLWEHGGAPTLLALIL